MSYTDLEFQNGAYTLRVAPWLDLALLREELKRRLRNGLEANGSMHHFLPEFRGDVLEFCEGERGKMPNCSETRYMIGSAVSGLFPISDNDTNRATAIEHISSRLLQRTAWTQFNRGGEAEEALLADKKLQDGFKDSDYTDDCGRCGDSDCPNCDCGGCGDCDMCDGY